LLVWAVAKAREIFRENFGFETEAGAARFRSPDAAANGMEKGRGEMDEGGRLGREQVGFAFPARGAWGRGLRERDIFSPRRALPASRRLVGQSQTYCPQCLCGQVVCGPAKRFFVY